MAALCEGLGLPPLELAASYSMEEAKGLIGLLVRLKKGEPLPELAGSTALHRSGHRVGAPGLISFCGMTARGEGEPCIPCAMLDHVWYPSTQSVSSS